MKSKSVFVFLLLLSLTGLVFSEVKPMDTVVVLPAQVENFSSAEESWLPGTIRDKIMANLNQFTKLTFVDDTNETQIKLLQKKYETDLYSTSIEIGKLTSAQYGIFSTVRKTGNTYSISCSFTNLKLGTVVFTTIVSEKKKLPELYEGAGCAVNQLTIQICEHLGIKLTASQKYILEHGDVDLSIEEKLQKEKDDEALFKSMMQEFDSQLEKLSYSTNLSVSAEQKKLEAQRAMTEEKLKATQLRTQRLLEEQQKAREDKIKDAERSEEQKRKRDEFAKKIASKADAVRKANGSNQSILNSIKITESKKHALLEIRENVEERLAEEINELEKESAAKIREINNKPYRAAELSQGKPSKDAMAAREEQKQIVKKQTEKKKQELKQSIQNSVSKQTSLLEHEISNDYKELAKTKSVSSLSADVKTAIGVYDGNKKSWRAEVLVFSDNVSLFDEYIDIPYTALTNKKIPSYKSDLYNDHLDAVDLYDSLFSRGEQVLIFEVDLCATPLNEKKPSQYEIDFTELRVKDMLTGRLIARKSVRRSVQWKFSPENDMRDKKIIAAEKEKQHIAAEQKRLAIIKANEKYREQQIRQRKLESKKRNRAMQLKDLKESFSALYHDYNFDDRIFIRATGNLGHSVDLSSIDNFMFFDSFSGFDLSVCFSSVLIFGAAIGKVSVANGSYGYWTLDGGLTLPTYPLGIYALVSTGPAATDLFFTDAGWLAKLSLGLDIPIVHELSICAQTNLNYLFIWEKMSGEFSVDVSCGITYSLW